MLQVKSPFWEALAEVPALRAQLVEISYARNRLELVRDLHFPNREALAEYIYGPLLLRTEAIGGKEAMEFLLRECGRLGV